VSFHQPNWECADKNKAYGLPKSEWVFIIVSMSSDADVDDATARSKSSMVHAICSPSWVSAAGS
jgi:hypothetical protein